MPSITVEKLRFDFRNTWQASKMDDWSFHFRQFQSVCGGSKAVDILAIEPKVCFWTIEVKDYRQHRRTKAMDVAEEIASKVRDSLAELVVASKKATNAGERAQAVEALRCPTFRVVLHLEQPAKHSKLFPRAINPANVRQRLKQLVRAIDPHPLVVEMDRMNNVPWSVHQISGR